MRRSGTVSRSSPRDVKGGKADRARRSSRQAGPDQAQAGYVRKQRLFAASVVLVAAVGIWLTFASVRSPTPEVPLTVRETAPLVYTVKVLDLLAADREAAEQIAAHPDVRALAGSHGMALRPIGENRLALCVGEFPSGDSPGVRVLVERFRQFKVKGDRMFADAAVYRLSQ